jgi:hypothetical protein
VIDPNSHYVTDDHILVPLLAKTRQALNPGTPIREIPMISININKVTFVEPGYHSWSSWLFIIGVGVTNSSY